MIGDLKRNDGCPVRSPDEMLERAVAAHGPRALALELAQLRKDVAGLGDLETLLAAVQSWAARGGGDYADLQPLFLARETALKYPRGLLDPAGKERRARWAPGEPYPLTYRWEKVATFLDELAPRA
jgi:hypothetical protein